MRGWLLPSMLLACSAVPVAARDSRLVSHLYKTDEVVRIEGQTNVQASIAFDDDEHIENVAIGDSSSWQVTPNKRANMLFVKPLGPRARTNLTVVTDRRTYYFDLVASPRSAPLYALRFTYPPESKPAGTRQKPAPASLTEEERQALLAPPAEQAPDPATLNFAWRAKGKSALVPARIYDDGTATYLVWSDGKPIPAILIRSAKGEEGPVNYAVRGNTIVVAGVPSPILLRLGRDSATLENQGKPRPETPASSLATAAPPIPAEGQ